MKRELRVVFDGPPSHESGRFVECEDARGRGVNAGEWRQRPNGLWELVITELPGGVMTGFDRYARAVREYYPDVLGAMAMFAVSAGIICGVVFDDPVYVIKGIALMFAFGAIGIGVMLTFQIFGRK